MSQVELKQIKVNLCIVKFTSNTEAYVSEKNKQPLNSSTSVSSKVAATMIVIIISHVVLASDDL